MADDSEKREDKGFKVRDRRRFSSEGGEPVENAQTEAASDSAFSTGSPLSEENRRRSRTLKPLSSLFSESSAIESPLERATAGSLNFKAYPLKACIFADGT